MIDSRTNETMPHMQVSFRNGYRAALDGHVIVGPNWPWTWYREGFRLGELLRLPLTDIDLDKIFAVLHPRWKAFCKAHRDKTLQPKAIMDTFRPLREGAYLPPGYGRAP